MRALMLGMVLSAISFGPTIAAETMTGKELQALLGQGKELILGGKGMGYTGSLALSTNGTGLGEVKLDDGTTIPIKGVWHIKAISSAAHGRLAGMPENRFASVGSSPGRTLSASWWGRRTSA